MALVRIFRVKCDGVDCQQIGQASAESESDAYSRALSFSPNIIHMRVGDTMKDFCRVCREKHLVESKR